MKVTNLILAVFLTATIAQAQSPPSMNADSILASTSALSFSNVQSTDEFVEKGGETLVEKLNEVEISSEEKAMPDFVFFAYPSIFTTELYVTTDLVESSEVQLVNEAGHVVFKQKTEGIIENEKFTIPSVLPAGTYFLKIKDKEAASVKLMKRN